VQAIDTNVVVRLLVHDDKEQGRRAEAIFRQAVDAGGVWLAQIVLVEVVWVLRSAYKFDRDTISRVLRSLVDTEGVTVEEAPLVLSGLAAFETGEADFSVDMDSRGSLGLPDLGTAAPRASAPTLDLRRPARAG
jgi:predicted nucleic-acid-binding protein